MDDYPYIIPENISLCKRFTFRLFPQHERNKKHTVNEPDRIPPPSYKWQSPYYSRKRNRFCIYRYNYNFDYCVPPTPFPRQRSVLCIFRSHAVQWFSPVEVFFRVMKSSPLILRPDILRPTNAEFVPLRWPMWIWFSTENSNYLITVVCPFKSQVDSPLLPKFERMFYFRLPCLLF